MYKSTFLCPNDNGFRGEKRKSIQGMKTKDWDEFKETDCVEK